MSCHTGLSYALARPALRRFTAETGPATAEERMLAAVNLRVAHWDELDTPRFRLMYDSDDNKRAESRGTEAVLNALILARDDAARGRSAPSVNARTSFQHLWQTQTKDGKAAGSWDWLNFGLAPWEANGSRTFGVALARPARPTWAGYSSSTRRAIATQRSGRPNGATG